MPASLPTSLPTGKRLYALVDCNNFYASCERIFQPHLQKIPIVVLSNNDGCIIARSQEAKDLGVPMAEPYHKAKDLIRRHRMAVFSSNYTLYGDISNRVMNVLSRFSAFQEIYSIDEAFLDFSHCQDPEETAWKLRATVLQWVGIPVSVGIGPTKTLAKVANRIAKKEKRGIFWLHSEKQIDSLLARIEHEAIWGIGRRLAPRLRAMGFSNALTLKQAPPALIRKQFGVVVERIVWELRGAPCLELEMVTPKRQSILASRSFGQLTGALEEIAQAVAHHASRAAEKLRSQNLLATQIGVSISTSPFRPRDPQYSKTHFFTLPAPSQDTGTLIHWATRALHHIYRPHYHYKKAGVLLEGLVDAEHFQLSLGHPGDDPRRQRLMSALDHINHLYGREALHSAATGIAPRWKMRSEQRSPRYTTNWNELCRMG